MDRGSIKLKKNCLILLLLTHDREGIKYIYDIYFPAIFNLIKLNGGLLEDAEDVFQEALIVLYQKAQSTDFELKCSFFTMFFSVCKNIWGSKSQKKYRTEISLSLLEEFEDSADFEQDLIKKELEQIFWSNFHSLPNNDQKLLKMAFDGFTTESIQQNLGFSSIGYTAKRKFVCKQKLFKLIKKDIRYQEVMRELEPSNHSLTE